MQSDDKKTLRKLIYRLLWALDDFDRNLRAIRQTEDISPQQLANLHNTRQQIMDAMSDSGVKFDGQVGDSYDPRFHEVLERRHDPSYPDNIIVEVFEIGCTWGDERIRMAKVAVTDQQPH